jgi:hypothetical protein
MEGDYLVKERTVGERKFIQDYGEKPRTCYGCVADTERDLCSFLNSECGDRDSQMLIWKAVGK